MGKVLNIKDEELREFFDNGFQSMRMNYYPPCPQPEKVMGLTPHSDGSTLTILLQINEVEGLQIKKDGKWIPIAPLPNAFIVNIGDTLEVIIMITFLGIFMSLLMCSNIFNISNISEKTPALFGRVTVEEYFRNRYARELRGKSQLDDLRIQNGQD